eukprot:354619-Prymnesium_polylepis.1
MGRPYWRAQLGRRPPPSSVPSMQDGIFPAGRGGMHWLPRLRLHLAQQPGSACRGIRRRELTAHLPRRGP